MKAQILCFIRKADFKIPVGLIFQIPEKLLQLPFSHIFYRKDQTELWHDRKHRVSLTFQLSRPGNMPLDPYLIIHSRFFRCRKKFLCHPGSQCLHSMELPVIHASFYIFSHFLCQDHGRIQIHGIHLFPLCSDYHQIGDSPGNPFRFDRKTTVFLNLRFKIYGLYIQSGVPSDLTRKLLFFLIKKPNLQKLCIGCPASKIKRSFFVVRLLFFQINDRSLSGLLHTFHRAFIPEKPFFSCSCKDTKMVVIFPVFRKCQKHSNLFPLGNFRVPRHFQCSIILPVFHFRRNFFLIQKNFYAAAARKNSLKDVNPLIFQTESGPFYFPFLYFHFSASSPCGKSFFHSTGTSFSLRN